LRGKKQAGKVRKDEREEAIKIKARRQAGAESGRGH